MVYLTQGRMVVLFGALIAVSGFPFSKFGCSQQVFLTDSCVYSGPVPFDLQEDPKVPERNKVELEQPSPYKIELGPPSISGPALAVESDACLQERIRQENWECHLELLRDSVLQVTQQWQASLNVFGLR